MTEELLHKKNKRDIANVIRFLMAKGEDGIPINQSKLAEHSLLSHDIISKILNPDKNKDYSPTIRTLSKVFSIWGYDFVEVMNIAKNNTFRF